MNNRLDQRDKLFWRILIKGEGNIFRPRIPKCVVSGYRYLFHGCDMELSRMVYSLAVDIIM